jgi:hypothetical protein
MLICLGCASVRVEKVGDPDGQPGVRFYRPRPYVAVFEPFIVGSEVHIAQGRLSSDGSWVVLTGLAEDEDLGGRLLSRAGDGSLRFPAHEVLAVSGGAQGDEEETPGEEEAATEEEAGGEEEEAGEELIPAPQPQDAVAPGGGISNLKVRNDPDAFSLTPLRRYFDIVWLPDFEEDYVVRGRAGFGNAAIDVGLGQGWSLQGLDASSDNSSIVGPILGLYQSSMKMLETLGKAKLGLPPGIAGGAQGVEERSFAGEVFDAGTPVTVKLTFVRIVAPGIYPVLKRTEIEALDVAVMEQLFGDRLLVPIYPYTRIAFHTYEVAVIEAAQPTGDSPFRLHQYLDRVGEGGRGRDAVGGGAGASLETRAEQAERDLEAVLGGSGEDGWTVELALDRQMVTARLEARGTPAHDQERARQIVTQLLAQRGLELGPDGVVFD